jgi:hypothetical protein
MADFNTISFHAHSARGSISSSRCVIEIEGHRWVTAQQGIGAGDVYLGTLVPLFITAINELERCLVPMIRKETPTTIDRCPDVLETIWKHSTALKRAILALGDVFEDAHASQTKDASVENRGEASLERDETSVPQCHRSTIQRLLGQTIRELTLLYDLVSTVETNTRRELRRLNDGGAAAVRDGIPRDCARSEISGCKCGIMAPFGETLQGASSSSCDVKIVSAPIASTH